MTGFRRTSRAMGNESGFKLGIDIEVGYFNYSRTPINLFLPDRYSSAACCLLSSKKMNLMERIFSAQKIKQLGVAMNKRKIDRF